MTAMIELPELAGRTAIWQRTGGWFRRHYALRIGEIELGTLTLPRFFSSAADAQVGKVRWRFHRRGLFRRTAHVTRPETEDDLATFQYRWNGEGLLESPGRRRFRWVREGFWGRSWSWRAEPGSVVVRFTKRGAFRPTVAVDVLHEARRYDELPLLLALGWYLFILHEYDSAAAA